MVLETWMRRRWPILPDDEKRCLQPEKYVTLMLLGMNGAGKSASGNTILGRNMFWEDLSPEAVTLGCQSAQTEMNGQTITVIDTVGLSDTDVKTAVAKTEIEKMLKKTPTGVDVFLLVINLDDKFTNAEQNAMKWIQKNFGAKVSKRTLVLFTHGDQLHAPVETYLNKSKTLQAIIHQNLGRYHVFKNKGANPSQVTELLDKIHKMRLMNGIRTTYRLQDYEEIQADLGLKENAISGVVLGIFFIMVSSALSPGKTEKIITVVFSC